ncbi:hypothetical protein SCACP_30460 [Sporomusa carbonis]|uniref:LysM peptidoglycan-binding domain-containing protein n=1 Tax=Sporomusa carbonis TaxID=3076075 RepID=UPI003A6F8DE4
MKLSRNRRNRLEAAALVVLLLIVAVLLCGACSGEQNVKKELAVVTHVVSKGETLWTIAEKYITPDRYMPEFIEGIYELNYDRVFVEREKNGAPRKSVYPGDRLEIRYWQVKKD